MSLVDAAATLSAGGLSYMTSLQATWRTVATAYCIALGDGAGAKPSWLSLLGVT